MEKMMFWAGYFPTKEDFEEYMDQTAFYEWWGKYDEDNLELRCQFCKELGIEAYDEDFLIMKYLNESFDIKDFIDYVPEKNNLIEDAVKRVGLKQANALICYDRGKEIPISLAENPTSVTYLGLFNYSTKEIMSRFSTAGMRFSVFAGTTTQTREEFMEYFNQDAYLEELRRYENGETKKKPNPNLRCQFCKDVELTRYYPEMLKIEFSDSPTKPSKLLEKVVSEKKLWKLILDTVSDRSIKTINCAFCYVANGFRDKKRDKCIRIYDNDLKDIIPRKKKDIDQLDNYNGLDFLGTFSWE